MVAVLGLKVGFQRTHNGGFFWRGHKSGVGRGSGDLIFLSPMMGCSSSPMTGICTQAR